MPGVLSWIDTLFFGVRRIFAAGTELPERPALNFGAGLTATDDPANNRTNVAADIAGTIGDDPTFHSVTATSFFRVGTGSKRLQDAAPSAAGHWTINEATGRLRGYTGLEDTPAFAHVGVVRQWNDDPVPLRFHRTDVDPSSSTESYYVLTRGLNKVYCNPIWTILYEGALTANNTNYASISVYAIVYNDITDTLDDVLLIRWDTRNSGGTHPTGNWTPDPQGQIGSTVASPGADVLLPADATIVLRIEKQGTGVVVPRFYLELNAIYHSSNEVF